MNQPYPLQSETQTLIGISFEIHNTSGSGFLEIVYKDALELELKKRGIDYQREKEYLVKYKEIILPHKFYADFVVYDSVILEIKAKEGIAGVHFAQVINYLRLSGSKVGLILNFGGTSLEIKRFVL